MKKSFKNIKILIITLTLFITVNNTTGAAQSRLSSGESLASTKSEADILTDKVRKQIEELNKGILHGAPQFSIAGKIDSVRGNQYTINGDTFIINQDTLIHGELKNDSYVEIRGLLVQGKPKLAKQVTVADSQGSSFPQVSADSSANSSQSIEEINAANR